MSSMEVLERSQSLLVSFDHSQCIDTQGTSLTLENVDIEVSTSSNLDDFLGAEESTPQAEPDETEDVVSSGSWPKY